MYWTELMERILKSEMAQKIVREVSPVYGDAYVALWLFEVIGRALDDMEWWTAEYGKQVVPQTATWSLPMWEARYGFTVEPDMPDEQRRNRIVVRRSTRAPINTAKLEKIAGAAAGGECRIEEHTGPNQFTLYLVNISGTVDMARVRRAVDAAKQAHLIYRANDRTEIVLDNSNIERVFLRNVKFHGCAPFWDCYVFDGAWKLDGTAELNQRRRYGLAFALKYGAYDIVNEETIAATVTTKSRDYWFFDGSFVLDGSRLLDSIYEKEVIV